MLHEYHAQMIIRERDRHLREVAELARLHHEATGSTNRRRPWARLRRRTPETSAPPGLRPVYTMRASPQ